ncbi:MAG: hypothetical protein SFV32_05645 [Opitutaceae bacterium]|nr:hypothetical protein [Opitutaceae bacterium]
MGIECLERTGIDDYRKSYAVLRRYADRAIVLKSYQDLCRVAPSRAGFPSWLIDRAVTAGFPRYAQLIVETNDPRNQAKTKRVMAKFEEPVDAEFRQSISEVQTSVFPKRLRLWKKEPGLSAEQLQFAHRMAVGITVSQYRQFFPGRPEPERSDALLWLPYLHAVALHALTLKWLKARGQVTAGSDTLRNDSVDIFYVTYESLFDGVVSGDIKLQEIYAMTKAILAYGEAQTR